MSNKEFIKHLEDYFTEVEFTDHARRKIDSLLNQYADKINDNWQWKYAKSEKKALYFRTLLKRAKKHSYPPLYERALPIVRLTEQQFNDIAEKICNTHNITLEELKGRERMAHYVYARIDFVNAVWKKHPSVTLKSIGRYLKKDHSTIIHYRRAIEAMSEEAAKAI